MEASFISSIAGAILSLVFSYVPGARQWYGALSGVHKRLVMLALLVVAAVLVVAAACSGWGGDFNISITCNHSGLVTVLKAFGAAVIANQSTYLVSPQISKG